MNESAMRMIDGVVHSPTSHCMSIDAGGDWGWTAKLALEQAQLEGCKGTTVSEPVMFTVDKKEILYGYIVDCACTE